MRKRLREHLGVIAIASIIMFVTYAGVIVISSHSIRAGFVVALLLAVGLSLCNVWAEGYDESADAGVPLVVGSTIQVPLSVPPRCSCCHRHLGENATLAHLFCIDCLDHGTPNGCPLGVSHTHCP